MKQFQSEHKTKRAGQPGTRCSYGCPYKTYKNVKTTVAVTNSRNTISHFCTCFIDVCLPAALYTVFSWVLTTI